MSRLATLGVEALTKVKSSAPEALRTITYKALSQDYPNISAIPDSLKFGEADGEAVKFTDGAWYIFVHEMPDKPLTDDVILLDGVRHHVISGAAADPAKILWRILTRA